MAHDRPPVFDQPLIHSIVYIDEGMARGYKFYYYVKNLQPVSLCRNDFIKTYINTC